MNCIDAIEGVVKKVISDLHAMHAVGEMDDTEYARNTRILIDGTDGFVTDNCEITSNPELLNTVLFEYARHLWMETLKEREVLLEATGDDEGYSNYYFEYIFRHGVYPE